MRSFRRAVFLFLTFPTFFAAGFFSGVNTYFFRDLISHKMIFLMLSIFFIILGMGVIYIFFFRKSKNEDTLVEIEKIGKTE